MTSAGRATAELGSFAAGLRFDDLPDATVAQLKRSILDTLGCGLHGSSLEWCRSMQSLVQADRSFGAASAWGTTFMASRTQAAWLNATAAHSFEFDDVHMGGMIHPGALTLSSSLAVGQSSSASGRDLLTSMAAGCEVAARVGRAVGTPHFLLGFHPQGTVGVFAAAAAAARTMGCNAMATQHALAIGASHSSGLMGAQRGAMSKRLHSGHAAQSGVQAALLAATGFTGMADALEAQYGGFCSTLGGGDVNLGLLTAGLGTTWESEQVAFKPYPSCAAALSSIEATRLLRLQHDLDSSKIQTVRVTTSHHAHVHSGWAYEPEGVTAAQMSIVYGVARMLLDGRLDAASFEDAAIASPDVVAFCQRIEVVADRRIDDLGPEHRYQASVEVVTTDSVFRIEVDDRPGNISNPLRDDDLRDKFLAQAVKRIGENAARDVVDIVSSIEDVEDVNQLASLLAEQPVRS